MARWPGYQKWRAPAGSPRAAPPPSYSASVAIENERPTSGAIGGNPGTTPHSAPIAVRPLAALGVRSGSRRSPSTWSRCAACRAASGVSTSIPRSTTDVAREELAATRERLDAIAQRTIALHPVDTVERFDQTRPDAGHPRVERVVGRERFRDLDDALVFHAHLRGVIEVETARDVIVDAEYARAFGKFWREHRVDHPR